MADRLGSGRRRGPDADNPSIGFYLAYLRHRPDSVVEAVRTMAEPGGAVLVHCAAGKDRTGVVVALALSAAGVSRDAVVADYVATGDRLEAVLARLLASPTYAADLDGTPADVHRPRPRPCGASSSCWTSASAGRLAGWRRSASARTRSPRCAGGWWARPGQARPGGRVRSGLCRAEPGARSGRVESGQAFAGPSPGPGPGRVEPGQAPAGSSRAA